MNDHIEKLLSRIASIHEERERIKRQADARLRELDIDERQFWFLHTAEISEFVKVEALARKRKNVTLLNGTLRMKPTPEKWIVADKAAARDFAERMGVGFKTVTSFDESTYKRDSVDAGEVFPGIEKIEAGQELEFKLVKPREFADLTGEDAEDESTGN